MLSLKRIISGFSLIFFIAGCASSPDELTTTHVSSFKYTRMSCVQLIEEVDSVGSKIVNLHASLDKKANDDTAQMAIGMIFFWPALFFLEGGDGPQAVEYSRLKGEREAIEKAARRLSCGLPPSKLPDSHEVKIIKRIDSIETELDGAIGDEKVPLQKESARLKKELAVYKKNKMDGYQNEIQITQQAAKKVETAKFIAPRPVKASPSVSNSEWVSSGSGFYLKGTTHIMSNLHVVGSSKKIRVSFSSREQYSAEIIARDVNNDIVILALQGMSPRTDGFRLNSDVSVDPGMGVHAIGFPLNSGISIVSGTVSSATGMNQNINKFTMTTPINEGNSGGPVIDEYGNLVGIAQGGLIKRGVGNFRFATKISSAVLSLKQARIANQFDVQVVRSNTQLGPLDIFKKFSPHVVRIEVFR